MRRSQRIVLLATLIAIAPAIAGCADFDADKLDIFHLNEKKKLPGERQPVFPEGVPGVTQGIPPEYIKGNEQQQTGAAIPMPQADGAAAAEPPKAEAKPKPKPKRTVKRKPKPKPAATAAAPAPQPQPAAAPAPWPAPAQSTNTAPSTAPWPSAPPPGTFSR
jgi:hypothetical protein